MVEDCPGTLQEVRTRKPPLRGASHVVAGFRYQVLQSVAALLSLRPGEELLLEVSEDFTIVGDDEVTDVQVKHSQAAGGPPSISLQSPEIASTLKRYWEASAEGSVARTLVFMSRSGAAVERDHAFPDNMPGLLYWRAAAMGADTAPLRAALAVLTEGSALGDWLASEPTDLELRTRLLRRVRWELQAMSAEQLQLQLREQVEEIYYSRNLPIMSARQAISSMMDLVFDTASKPVADDRRLTHLDLERTLESTVTTQLLVDAVSRPSASPVLESPLVAELEAFFTPAAQRRDAVDALLDQTRGQPVIWIHGSNNVGKSTLARLTAGELGGRWLELDLRAVQSNKTASLAAWRDLNRAIALSEPYDGVIIDDFDDAAADVLRSRLPVLARMFGSRAARLIITSHHVPSPAMLSDCGAVATSIFHAPYFSDGDIQEIVDIEPRPADDMIAPWCASLRVTTNGGHPLLVAAKAASLRARGWPTSALVDDFIKPSEAVQITRDEARRTLLADLSSLDQIRSIDAGDLLRRIACVFGTVDEGLIRRLAAEAPALRTAGDALAVLKGSWLEILPAGDLRISPLLADLAKDLPNEEHQGLQRTAAEYWLSTKTLDGRTLPLCFWNAFWGEHSGVLMRICVSIETLPRDVLRGAAALLSPMTSLTIDRLLFPSNPAVSVQLRLLQFEVANASEQGELAAKIARRLMEETSLIDHADIRALLTHTSTFKLLTAESAKIPPNDRIAYALALRDAEPKAIELAKGAFPDPKSLMPPKFRDALDTADVFFAMVVNHIDSSSAQLETVRALDAIPTTQRNGFLDAMSVIYEGDSVFVHSGWSQDQLTGGNMEVALEAYEEIETIVSAWNRLETTLEVICARAIILDEGFERYDDALAVVEAAINSHGEQPDLLRQKSKILGHAGRDSEAVAALLPVEDTIFVRSPFDRALALRDAAVSAAKAGLFPDALRLIKGARAALAFVPNREALSVGFDLEQALISWWAGNHASAIKLTANALEQVRHISVDESKQALRSHKFARAMAGLFFSEMPGMPSSHHPPPFGYGSASILESNTDPPPFEELPSIGDNMRILAIVEAACCVDLGVDAQSQMIQAGSMVPSFEFLLRQVRYANALESGEVLASLSAGVEATWALAVKQRYAFDQQSKVRVSPEDLIVPDRSELFSDSSFANRLQTLVLDIVLFEKLRGSRTLDDAFWQMLRDAGEQTIGDSSIIGPIIDIAEGKTQLGMEASVPMAYAKVLVVPEEQVAANPAVRFQRDVKLLLFVVQSIASHAHLPILVKKLLTDWRFVIESQRFMLRTPSRLVPEIDAALANLERNCSAANVARLLEAVAPAVGQPFDVSLVESLDNRAAGSGNS